MDLLAQHHRNGRRFEPLEFIEQGQRVVVRLAVTDPHWEGAGESFKVFTFRGADEQHDIVLLQDTIGKEHALSLLAHS